MPDYSFTVAAVPHLPFTLYEQFLSGISNVEVVIGDMKKVLSCSEAAIVTSGTATLETALLGVPQIVVYKGSSLSYRIAKRLIKVRFISLVNLIADKLLVPELIQVDCNPAKMKEELIRILNPEVSGAMRETYHQLSGLLTSGGGAEAAATDIISDIRHTNHGKI